MKEIIFLDNDLVHDVCPLCFSNSIVNKGTINYTEPLLYSSTYIRLKRKSELWYCITCRSGFVQYAIQQKDAEAIYLKSNSNERWPTVNKFINSKTNDIISKMKEILPNTHTVLDVGCNTGELLDYAKSFNCTTYGIEFSSMSKDICISKGHKIIDNIDYFNSNIDAITAFDIIEHLYDVNKFMEKCFKALKHSGKLIVLTGNILSLPSKITKNRWWYVSYPEHIIFPSIFFLKSLNDWIINSWLPCYNGVMWMRPFIERLKSLKGLLNNKYSGYPSFCTDHILIVLEARKGNRN